MRRVQPIPVSMYGEGNNNLIIERMSNGWQVTLPINYPDINPEEEYFSRTLKETGREMMQEMKKTLDDDPMLHADKQEHKKETNTYAPLIGYIAPRPNVFVFKEWKDVLEFLRTKVY